MDYRFLTKPELRRLNTAARRTASRRAVTDAAIDAVADDVRCPIILAFDHNGREMRCGVLVDARGTTFWIDVDYAEFENLPRWEA